MTASPEAIWICNPFDNLPEEGAPPQRYAALAAELASRGHAATWWTADFSHAKKERRRTPSGDPLPAAYESPAGVRMRLVPTPPYPRNVCFARMASHRAFARSWLDIATDAVRRGEERRPDVVLVSVPPLSTYRAAALLRERFGAPVALDVMDAWPDAFERLLPPPFRRLAAALLFRRARRLAEEACRGADLVSGVSEGYIALARRRGAQAPAAVFRHACATLHAPGAPRPGAPLRIVYAGNMGAFYDLATALDAVKALAAQGLAVTLDLAGAGPDEPRLRRRAEGVPAIRFHGFLGADALAALLDGADAGLVPLYPSSSVAMPYKLADYASRGLAILSCLDGECNGLVLGYGAGLRYQAGDAASLADAISTLARDPAALSAMRAASLRLAAENFLASAIYPAFADFLTQAAGGK